MAVSETIYLTFVPDLAEANAKQPVESAPFHSAPQQAASDKRAAARIRTVTMLPRDHLREATAIRHRNHSQGLSLIGIVHGSQLFR